MFSSFILMAIEIPIILNRENILKRINSTQIFEFYLGVEVQFTSSFRSPLRKDNFPGCGFYPSKSGVIRFIDRSRSYIGDCFDIVMALHSCNFYDALKIINRDFKLGLGCGDVKGGLPTAQIQNEEVIKITKKPFIIGVQAQSFTRTDLRFWGQYGIDERYLKGFDVFSASGVWLNGRRFLNYSAINPCYAYRFGTRFKIYRPYNSKTDYKWLSNTTSNDIQGLHQLPKDNKVRELCFITKSLKDVMVLHTLGFYAVAPQSEGNRITNKLIDYLYKRFDNLVVFYDNDEAGLIGAKKVCDEHNLSYIVMPNELSKDISDYRSETTTEEARKLINKLIYG